MKADTEAGNSFHTVGFHIKVFMDQGSKIYIHPSLADEMQVQALLGLWTSLSTKPVSC